MWCSIPAALFRFFRLCHRTQDVEAGVPHRIKVDDSVLHTAASLAAMLT